MTTSSTQLFYLKHVPKFRTRAGNRWSVFLSIGAVQKQVSNLLLRSCTNNGSCADIIQLHYVRLLAGLMLQACSCCRHFCPKAVRPCDPTYLVAEFSCHFQRPFPKRQRQLLATWHKLETTSLDGDESSELHGSRCSTEGICKCLWSFDAAGSMQVLVLRMRNEGAARFAASLQILLPLRSIVPSL